MNPAIKNRSSSPKLTTTGADNTSTETASKRPIWEIIVEIGAQIPEEEWAKVPADASINCKHYLYGATPKDV